MSPFRSVGGFLFPGRTTHLDHPLWVVTTHPGSGYTEGVADEGELCDG